MEKGNDVGVTNRRDPSVALQSYPTQSYRASHPTSGVHFLGVFNIFTFIVALSNHDIRVARFSGANSFHVSGDGTLCLGMCALSQ